MKIFISYGHNDHTALVDALYDALLRDGHQPWKDDRYEGSSGIPAGEDFTAVIYDAIRDSDFVIAFATAATMRSRYCCDERQYAYNMKGSHFIQLRLDGVEIRLGNAGSYIDMDAAEQGGSINRPVFESRLQALYAAFRDPATLLSPSASIMFSSARWPLEYSVTWPTPMRFSSSFWMYSILSTISCMPSSVTCV